MYLTEMIKALPTQSGRYLAPAAALSRVLKRQQHRPKIQHWLQGKKRSKVNREAFAKFSKGVFSACLLELGPMLLSAGQSSVWAAGQQDWKSPPPSHRNQRHPPPSLAESPLAKIRCVPRPGHPLARGLAFPICTPNKTKSNDLVPSVLFGKPSYAGCFQVSWATF